MPSDLDTRRLVLVKAAAAGLAVPVALAVAAGGWAMLVGLDGPPWRGLIGAPLLFLAAPAGPGMTIGNGTHGGFLAGVVVWAILSAVVWPLIGLSLARRLLRRPEGFTWRGWWRAYGKVVLAYPVVAFLVVFGMVAMR